MQPERAKRRFSPGKAPIVPPGSVTGRSLMLVIAIMGFLACLTAGAVYMVNQSAASWLRDVASEVTVQIKPDGAAEDLQKRSEDVVKFLTGLQGDTALVNEVHLAPSHQSLLPLYYRQFPTISPAQLKTVYLGALKYGVESSNHLLASFGAIDNSLGQDIQPIMLGKKTAAQQLPIAQADLNRVLTSMK